ncbi:MAG: glutathione peroxidase [Bdellovibrionales bacterium]|nr:glutathione peroxidase [Bdellovibrionales bacterium]
MSIVHDFKVKNAKGDDVSLSNYKGKVVLIVNVASECGFTPQYEGLQKLHEQFSGRGFEVLGFPCNQFGGQEPGTNDEIQGFCTGRFGVRFPVFAKIDVNGGHADPLYAHLKHEAPGILGTEGIKWNFTKFLVGKDGQVIKRYAPNDKPEAIVKDIETAISSS